MNQRYAISLYRRLHDELHRFDKTMLPSKRPDDLSDTNGIYEGLNKAVEHARAIAARLERKERGSEL